MKNVILLMGISKNPLNKRTIEHSNYEIRSNRYSLRMFFIQMFECSSFKINFRVALILILMIGASHLLQAQEIDTTLVCPSIEEIEKSTLLSVFPNPSNGTFQIIYASTTTCPPPGWGGVLLVNIINSNGKTVYTESIANFEGEYNKTIDLNSLEKGVFIIEVVSGKQKKVKREVLN